MQRSNEAYRWLRHEVLSWPVSTILNQEQLPDKVETIPEKFDTRADYTKSFRSPILEEIWHQIYSGMDTISGGLDVESFEKSRWPKDKGQTRYQVKLILPKRQNSPKPGDLMLISARALESRDQILKQSACCAILWVKWVSEIKSERRVGSQEKQMAVRMTVLPSLYPYGDELNLTRVSFQAVHLTNLTTFDRSWQVMMNCFPESSEIISLILSKNNDADGECSECTNKASFFEAARDVFELNDSQSDAVATCISATNCSHRSSLRLIWGPPGTGKTKTVSVMLHMLLTIRKQHRILACAPTNAAILQLASHLVGLFEKSSRSNCYALGDIVLFGNEDRMKADKELSKILLKNHVAELSKCLDQKDELKRSVDDFVDFLKNCSSRFRAVPHEQQKNTFKEYFTEAFSTSVKYIATYTDILIDHLPMIPKRAEIMSAISLVEKLQKLLCLDDNESLTRILEHSNNHDGLSDSEKHAVKIKSLCIDSLMKLQFPEKPKEKLEDIFLDRAKLIFCTPSMSSKLNKWERDILVIDEAANLKECESMIPLAIQGIKHAVLIGDDKQLQSVVKSPIAKEAKYGRSLFERLCEIGYGKHLLNVQYRMHPSISRFPNKNFYDGKIIDGPNVKDHHNSYLPGNIYGTYSFIHIEDGMEEHSGQSSKNMVEAAVAANIVDRLAEACSKQTKRTSVGVISQYAAQVTALQERIGSFENHEFLSVKVQTIDSFQGDEKDIIILSTVRCNRGGNVGFLDSDRRTNVALTRAKNCLWILGHETTLRNSNSIWCSLVDDAKRRQCSFDAREDKYLAGTIEELCRKQVKVMQVPDTIQTPLSMGRVNAMHENIAEDEVLAPLGVCSQEEMFLVGPLSSHQDQSQVHEVLAPLGVCSQEEMSLEGPLSSHQHQSQVLIDSKLKNLSDSAVVGEQESQPEDVPASGVADRVDIPTESELVRMREEEDVMEVDLKQGAQDDKEPQLTSRKRRKSAGNDIGDKSDSCLQKKLNMSVQDMVKETEQMPLAQFSPSQSPWMKRARSLGQDQLASLSSCQPAVPSPSQSSQCASIAQLADELEQSLDTRPEVPEAGEPAQAAVAAGAGVPAQAVEAAVFPDATTPAAAVDPPPAPIIEHLQGLSQLAEALVRKPMNYRGPDGKKARKSLLTAGADGKRYQTGINFYERARTATDERFWSIEQQDLYTSAYGVKKNFAKNKWIDWDGIRPYEEFQYVEKKCHDTGLHRVMAARHDWHVEKIKQFFATFYINPSRTSLTWMTGINRKITVTKRFWEEILLDLSVHDGRNDYPKIKGSLTDKEEEQLRNANPTLINATNRMLRTTIFPKAGDKTTVHNENKLMLYHILFGKPFDVVDMMLREIQKTRRDTRMLIPYAPYIMLLIKCATREEFVPASGGTAWFKHPKYNIMPQKPRQPGNIRASKSKQPFRVPPRPALVAPPLVPAVAGAAATLVAAAPPLAPVRDPVAAEPPQPVDRHAQPPCQREVGQCLLECLKHRSKEECLKEMLSEVPPERALPVIGDYLRSLPPS